MASLDIHVEQVMETAPVQWVSRNRNLVAIVAGVIAVGAAVAYLVGRMVIGRHT